MLQGLAIRSLEEAFGSDEMAKQYAARYGNDCKYMPSSTADIWYCTCGAVNYAKDEKCYRCRRKRSALESVNLNSLKSESEQRAAAEKAADEAELEEKAEIRKRRHRLLRAVLWIVPILLVIALVAATVPAFIRQHDAYEEAEMLLESEEFEAAQEAFLALGDFSDAADRAHWDVPYEKAAYIIRRADNPDRYVFSLAGMQRTDLQEDDDEKITLLKKAKEMLTPLGDYKDSLSMIADIEKASEEYEESLRLADYVSAATLLEKGAYLRAKAAFASLGDYKDSEEMQLECLYRRAKEILGFCQNNNVRHINLAVSKSEGTDTLISMPGTVLTGLGSDAIYSLKQCFSEDGVQISYDDEVPSDIFVPICDAVKTEFLALGDYKDSADLANAAEQCADFTAEFYTLLREGKLEEGLEWLQTYDDEIPYREQFVGFVDLYRPYCGSWELFLGDSSLIPNSVGITDARVGTFTSGVSIEGDTAYLHLNAPDGGCSAVLSTELGKTDFKMSNDDWIYYYAILNTNVNHLVYYMCYGTEWNPATSCEYNAM